MSQLNRHSSVAIALATIVSLTAACRSTPTPPTVSADAWAVVNGKEITRDEVEKTFRRTGNPAQPLSEEEATAAKLGILDELIMEEILLALSLIHI